MIIWTSTRNKKESLEPLSKMKKRVMCRACDALVNSMTLSRNGWIMLCYDLTFYISLTCLCVSIYYLDINEMSNVILVLMFCICFLICSYNTLYSIVMNELKKISNMTILELIMINILILSSLYIALAPLLSMLLMKWHLWFLYTCVVYWF